MLSLLAEQRRKIDEVSSKSLLANSEKIHMYKLLISYIEQHHDNYEIYTPSTLRQATHCKNDKELYEVISFFSGGYSNLFDVKYCYYQDAEQLDIRKDEFINFIENRIEPVDKNGMDIDDFDPENLSFYCVISHE